MKPRNVLLMITPYSHPRAEGISRFAKEHAWNLMVADRLGEDEDPRAYDGVLMTLRDKPAAVKAAKRLAASGVAVVDLTIECPDVPLPRVVSDHEEIGRIATDHFAERGFMNFAWFSSGWSNVHALRMKGFANRCPEGANVLKWESPGLAGTVAAAPKPIAVLTYNDVDAARLVAACRVAGCAVPQDVAVLGIGNDPFLCENQATPLSSVEQDLARNAYEGAALLEKLMSLSPSKRSAAGRRRALLTPPGNVMARESSDTLAHANPVIRDALVFIQAHLGKPFGSREVAEGIGIARSKLDHLFASEAHHSVGDEIRRQRLCRAKSLLKAPSVPIFLVAHTCGFCNSAYLTNTFRRETGLTPKAWRKQNTPAVPGALHTKSSGKCIGETG
jgi:LacI family transcriptional regulator